MADFGEVVDDVLNLVNLFEGTFPVYHADLYRIDGDQIAGTGLDEAFEESGAIVVEWGEKGGFAEGEQLHITTAYTGMDSGRRIVMEWSPNSTWQQRMYTIMRNWDASSDAIALT